MKLDLISEHQDDGYPEIGEVTGLYWNHDRSIFAVVSVRSPGVSGIRPPLRSDYAQRLSLYDAGSKRLINSVAGLHYRILDVGFHPSENSLLIGTGEFDGGYFLQGELALWNWSTNGYRLLASNPSFIRARFTSQTNLELLVSPLDEEDIESGEDAFKTFRSVTVSLSDLAGARISDEQLARPLAKNIDAWAPDFEPLGMYSEERKQFETQSQQDVAQILGISGSRGAVLDILSTGTRIITIKNRPAFELRGIDGKLLVAHENVFSGAQIFPLEDGRLLINTDKYEPYYHRAGEIHGRLMIWSAASEKLETFLEGANPFLLSRSSEGNVLARSCGRYSKSTSIAYQTPVGVDFLVKLALDKRPLPPLGSIDRFGYLSTEDSKELYYLGPEVPWEGFPAPHPMLAVFAVNSDSIGTRLVDLVDKRPDSAALEKAHRFLNLELFKFYPGGNGDHLIGAGNYFQETNAPTRTLVWRHDLPGKTWLWQKSFSEGVRMLCSLPSLNAVLVGFDKGVLRLLDSATGETLDELNLMFAGIPSLPMEACLDGEEIILATLESRILRFRIEH